MSDVLREAVLIAAALTMGLMSGVFGIYSNAIMPGLRRTDDRTFVAAFQSIDRAIINPAFMVTFVGALVFTALARCSTSVTTTRRCCPGSKRRLLCTSSSSSQVDPLEPRANIRLYCRVRPTRLGTGRVGSGTLTVSSTSCVWPSASVRPLRAKRRCRPPSPPWPCRRRTRRGLPGAGAWPGRPG
jgi:hypothetical protein